MVVFDIKLLVEDEDDEMVVEEERAGFILFIIGVFKVELFSIVGKERIEVVVEGVVDKNWDLLWDEVVRYGLKGVVVLDVELEEGKDEIDMDDGVFVVVVAVEEGIETRPPIPVDDTTWLPPLICNIWEEAGVVDEEEIEDKDEYGSSINGVDVVVVEIGGVEVVAEDDGKINEACCKQGLGDDWEVVDEISWDELTSTVCCCDCEDCCCCCWL